MADRDGWLAKIAATAPEHSARPAQEGRTIAGLSLAVASWIRFVLGKDESGNAIDVRDPLAELFAAISDASTGEPADLVARFLEIEDVFGRDLVAERRFISVVVEQLRSLIERGAVETVRDFAADCAVERGV